MNRNLKSILSGALSAISCLITPDSGDCQSLSSPMVLVSYSFDDSTLAVDGERLMLFQNAKGHVGLSHEFALSGYNAIELVEEQFDGDFTEIQGRFPQATSGTVRFHFALLIENPEEELNIAVAGKEHFKVKKDGIALWLHTKNGVLIHESDSISKKLFSIVPFRWYIFDVMYNIDSGKYDLFVSSDDSLESKLELTDQRNASGNPKSEIDRFSFIGDLGDRSKVHYYIDDVILTKYTSAEVAREAIKSDRGSKLTASYGSVSTDRSKTSNLEAAIGNIASEVSTPRKGFLDGFIESQTSLHLKARCIPATKFEDLEVEPEILGRLISNIDGSSFEERLTAALQAKDLAAELEPLKLWNDGCAMLADQKLKQAIELFRNALRTSSDNALYSAALVVALSHENDLGEAQDILSRLEMSWATDPRLLALKAYVESHKGRFQDAKNVLSSIAEQLKSYPQDHIIGEFLAGDSTDVLMESLKHDFPNDWRKRLDDLLIVQNYFYNLVWNSDFVEAQKYAHDIYFGLKKLNINGNRWREREADAAYLAGNLRYAANIYLELLKNERRRRVLWRKLLDVLGQLGDRKAIEKTRREFSIARSLIEKH